MNKQRDWKVAIELGRKALTAALLCGALVFATLFESVSAEAQSATAATGKSDIIAIDISLAPDSTMIQHATADNARLLKTGPISAFTAPQDSAALDADLIQYFSTFVPKMSGDNFNPHVSIGVAPRAYLDRMIAEPFTPFTFSPVGANVYHLGPYGTAAKKLKEWRPKP